VREGAARRVPRRGCRDGPAGRQRVETVEVLRASSRRIELSTTAPPMMTGSEIPASADRPAAAFRVSIGAQAESDSETIVTRDKRTIGGTMQLMKSAAG